MLTTSLNFIFFFFLLCLRIRCEAFAFPTSLFSRLLNVDEGRRSNDKAVVGIPPQALGA